MADPEFYIKKQPRLGHLVPPNQPNASKFYTQFMCKAVIVAIFVVILVFFPSQAPEFFNQSLDTRSWELVQLLLVGIAVSYGLFSRKNDETEKEHSSTFDNAAQSYVSRLLQVSSVFEDDDSESPSVSSDENNKKVQTWSSQYFRGEPVVVVAQQNSVIDEKQSGSASASRVDKPLLLPIRSLKSRVDFSETANESSGGKGSSLNSGSKCFSSNSNSKTRNGEVGGSIPLDKELKAEENVVLRSPIPWRSRSGRMEMKEETDDDGGGVPLYSHLPPSMEDSDFNRLRSQSKPSPMSISSLKNTFSSNSVEEVPRKKIYYKSSPPPAPPPPPPPPLYVRKPPLAKSNSTLSNPEDFTARELKRRSSWSVTKELMINSTETGEMQNRANSGAESRPRVPSDDGSLMGKSVQTTRLGEPIQQGIPKTGFVDYDDEWEEKQEFEENVVVETDEESEESEADKDLFDGGSENDNENENENEEAVSNNVGDFVGKDVDQKADEFIAKFREQIRLQRIDSIKRSTGLIAKSSNR